MAQTKQVGRIGRRT